MAAQFGRFNPPSFIAQPWVSTPFCRALLFGSPFQVPSVSMAVITKRPSPGQGAPTRLRRREPRRELQRLSVDDRQAQAQYPATQPDVYPDAGKPDPAQLQASNPKSPDNIAPDLRQASFIPPASLRGRRSTAEVDIIQVYGLAGHTIENTKTRIRDFHKRDPLRPWRKYRLKRVADVMSHLRRSRTMQTYASQYLFNSTEDEMKEIDEQKTDQTKATDSYIYEHPDDWISISSKDEMKETNEQKTDQSKATDTYIYEHPDDFNGRSRADFWTSKAAFWISQAAPDGRLFYYNMMTGDRSMELPLQSPVSNNETGPRDRMNVTVPKIPRDANGTAGGRETDWTRRYQAARKSLQLEPQKQQEKKFSIVPTISKDHTAGEQARQAGLLAELGRGEKRHLSRIHTDGEQHILDSLARKKPKRDK